MHKDENLNKKTNIHGMTKAEVIYDLFKHEIARDKDIESPLYNACLSFDKLMDNNIIEFVHDESKNNEDDDVFPTLQISIGDKTDCNVHQFINDFFTQIPQVVQYIDISSIDSFHVDLDPLSYFITKFYKYIESEYMFKLIDGSTETMLHDYANKILREIRDYLNIYINYNIFIHEGRVYINFGNASEPIIRDFDVVMGDVDCYYTLGYWIHYVLNKGLKIVTYNNMVVKDYEYILKNIERGDKK